MNEWLYFLVKKNNTIIFFYNKVHSFLFRLNVFLTSNFVVKFSLYKTFHWCLISNLVIFVKLFLCLVSKTTKFEWDVDENIDHYLVSMAVLNQTTSIAYFKPLLKDIFNLLNPCDSLHHYFPKVSLCAPMLAKHGRS